MRRKTRVPLSGKPYWYFVAWQGDCRRPCLPLPIARIPLLPTPPSSLQMARALVKLAPQDADGLSAVAPLLHRLMPLAELHMYGMAAPYALPRAVLACGLHGALTAERAPLIGGAACTTSVLLGAELMAEVAGGLVGWTEQQAQQLAQLGVQVASPSLGWALEEVPVSDLASLASALVAAGGSRQLPRGAAAALLRLLSCSGVVVQLSRADVARAVWYSLADAGLPIPDPLADAIVGKLTDVDKSDARRRLLLRSQLRKAGASASHVHCALLALLDEAKPLSGYSPSELLLVLTELESSGVVEPMPYVLRHHNHVGDLVGVYEGLQAARHVSPYAYLAGEAVQQYSAEARRNYVSLDVDARSLIRTLRVAAVLEGRLERLQGNVHPFRRGVNRMVQYAVSSASQDTLHALANSQDGVLWELLEAAYALGKRRRASGLTRSALDKLVCRMSCTCTGLREPEVLVYAKGQRERTR